MTLIQNNKVEKQKEKLLPFFQNGGMCFFFVKQHINNVIKSQRCLESSYFLIDYE